MFAEFWIFVNNNPRGRVLALDEFDARWSYAHRNNIDIRIVAASLVVVG